MTTVAGYVQRIQQEVDGIIPWVSRISDREGRCIRLWQELNPTSDMPAHLHHAFCEWRDRLEEKRRRDLVVVLRPEDPEIPYKALLRDPYHIRVYLTPTFENILAQVLGEVEKSRWSLPPDLEQEIKVVVGLCVHQAAPTTTISDEPYQSLQQRLQPPTTSASSSSLSQLLSELRDTWEARWEQGRYLSIQEAKSTTSLALESVGLLVERVTIQQQNSRSGTATNPPEVCEQIHKAVAAAGCTNAPQTTPAFDNEKQPPIPDKFKKNFILALVGGFRRCNGEVTRNRAEENASWSLVAR